MMRGRVAILAVTVAVAAAIVIIAFVTGVRRIAYATLATVVLRGLWPIAMLVGGLALLMIVAVVVGLTGAGVGKTGGLGDAGVGVVGGGAKLPSGHFRLLRRMQHALVWGIVFGVVVGAAAVWAILAFYVIPREQMTLRTLVNLQQRLDQTYASTGRYPDSLPDGTVPARMLDGGDSAAALPDAFGRPITYHLVGFWKVASYSLSSLGADGRPSDDDICVAGGTQLGTWLQRVARPMRALWALAQAPGPMSLRDGIEAVLASRCAAATPPAP